MIDLEKCINDSILDEVKKHYGTSELEFIGGYENHVYEFTSDQTYIVRIGSSDHRTSSEIEAELNWIEYLIKDSYLSEHIISPKRTINNELQFTIPVTNGYLNVNAFHKASGKLVDIEDKTQWNQAFFEQLGKIMGRIHKLSKKFPMINRRKFYEEEKFDIETKLKRDPELLKIVREELKDVKSISYGPETWGLIHNDFHWGNYFYNYGNAIVFDFDDCCYGPFINDIAISVFNPLVYFSPEPTPSGLDARNKFAKNFLSSFINGYNSHSNLPEEEWNKIPYYLKVRDINFYTDAISREDPSKINEEFKHGLELMRERIINKHPIITLKIDELIHD